MKKLAVMSLAAMMAASSVHAAQPAGELVAVQVAGTVILVSAATAMIINHRSPTLPVDNVVVDPKCAGNDPKLNGFCVGTYYKTVVTGTGTATYTIQVPVTFTYKPS